MANSTVVGCSICFESFKCNTQENLIALATPCGHIYHQSCLQKWMDGSTSCPDCRNTINDEQIKRIYFNSTLDDEITKYNTELEQLTVEKKTMLDSVDELNRQCDELRKTLMEQEQLHKQYKKRSNQNILFNRQVDFVDKQLDEILQDVMHMKATIDNVEKKLNICELAF